MMVVHKVSGKNRTYVAEYAEGVKKVSGKARFTCDLEFTDMLVGKLLHSEYPRARISRLDISAAEALPGVKAVVTYRDIPGERFFGRIVKDQPILAIDEVSYIGDIVAAVAALDEETALHAIKTIEVEYEPLPGVFEPVEAMEPCTHLARSDLESNILAHFEIVHGNVEMGFADADAIVEKIYRTAYIDQLFLETEGAIANWDGDYLTVYAGGQYPHRDRIQISKAMALPANRVRVIYPYVGGSFGGKDDLHIQIPVSLLAWKAKQPVKMILRREESLFSGHGKRASFVIWYKTGSKSDGTLTAIDVKAILDSGPYSGPSPAIASFAAQMASGCYRIPNARINVYAVATNNIIGGAMRGFGGPEMMFAVEQNIDLLAKKLKMDPLELRLKNGMEKDTIMPSGAYIYYDIGLKETMEGAAKAADWFNRHKWLEREPAPYLRRGMGVASIWHGMGIGRLLQDHAHVSVEMLPDGTVLLLSGTADLGQGARSVQLEIAARELGVRPEDVRVNQPDTNITPDAGATVTSKSVYMLGNAIIKAAGVIRQSLLEVASEELKLDLKELDIADGYIWVKRYRPKRCFPVSEIAEKAWLRNKQLHAIGHYEMWHPSEPKIDFNFPYSASIFCYATHIAQVLVDIETGQVKVEKVWAAHDVGKALDMIGIENQIHGGVAQGVGSSLIEELRMKNGRLLTTSLASYLVPTALDIPEIESVIIEVPEPSGPYGAKGIAEATISPVAAAIANAVADATGARIDEIPMTPERILVAIEKSKTE